MTGSNEDGQEYELGSRFQSSSQSFDPSPVERYALTTRAIEFTTELNDSRTLPIPQEVAAQLPKSGRARIIVLTDELTGDAEWRLGAYQQFLRDDAPEDAIYDSCR